MSGDVVSLEDRLHRDNLDTSVEESTASIESQSDPAPASTATVEVDQQSDPELELPARLEALLYLSSEPVIGTALADACEEDPEVVEAALAALQDRLKRENHGLVLRQIDGGWSLATDPRAESAARRLFARPRTPQLSSAQAETLAIIAYLQPVSRPEIARIRGVNAESATLTLAERGLIEEAGRTRFGATQYRTAPLFMRLFGLSSLEDLPDPSQWDATPEEEGDLRERLLRAGQARGGGEGDGTESAEGQIQSDGDAASADVPTADE